MRGAINDTRIQTSFKAGQFIYEIWLHCFEHFFCVLLELGRRLQHRLFEHAQLADVGQTPSKGKKVSEYLIKKDNS